MKYPVLMIAFFMFVLLDANAQEISPKRKAPSEVKSIVYKGIEYSAPTFKKGFDSTMGMVFATEKATGKELWNKKVYEVKIDENLERDVQTVYIKSMKRKGNFLIIENEREKTYKLNLKTQEVQAMP